MQISKDIYESQNSKRQKNKEMKSIKLCHPLFWKKCENCAALTKKEDMWRHKIDAWHDHCDGDGHPMSTNYKKWIYLCLNCTPAKQDAFNYFYDKEGL